jgi:hypothetical protein
MIRPAALWGMLMMLVVPAAAGAHPVEVAISADHARAGPVFEGWGTALAWFAEVTGAYPEPVKAHVADLLYGPGGLGFTIARFNIGGGNAPDVASYLRVGAAIPGYWRRPDGVTGVDWWRADRPDMWDRNADPDQRWWLDAVKARVAHPVFEAFSNSPPWFMTVSGRVSGAVKGADDNLRPGQEQAFADYLASTVEDLQRRHGITFRTLSPVNEPNTDYWHASNTQEGAHWSPARQAMMIDATARALKARGLATRVAAMDETASDIFMRDWAAYPAATRARIGQLNVHSYGTANQTGVRDAARAAGIRLWMSENDTPDKAAPEDFEDMRSALALADHIVGDLRHLEPSAWVFWQAVETLSAHDGKPGSNWGLLKMDLHAAPDAPHPVFVTRKYWAMANFSRFIRPGMRLLFPDDEDTVGARSRDGRSMTFVHVNAGTTQRWLVLRVAGRWSVRVVTTAQGRHAVSDAPRLMRGRVRILVPAGSITSLSLRRS